MTDVDVPDPRAPQRIRHETRLRQLTVSAITDITPAMRRIRLTGDMAGFASLGHADHIKVFLYPQGVEPTLVSLPEGGIDFGPGERPQMRDYTPRHWSVQDGWLDIDFALHGDGPAAGWAASARLGDSLLIGGPRGSMVVPATFDWYLLAGDDTALPALGRRIEELPKGATIVAIIEVDGPRDEQQFVTQAELSLHYVHRAGQAPGSTTLILDALASLPLPAGTGYAFVAGEVAMSRAVRDHLVAARGFDPAYVKAAGYWQIGVADAKAEH